METWATTSSTYDKENKNTGINSLCTPQKPTNGTPTPTSTPIVFSSTLYHQHSNDMVTIKSCIANNTYGLDTPTYSQNVMTALLCGSKSNNNHHDVISNGGFDDLLCPPNDQALPMSKDLLIKDQLPSWFDILLMSLPHYSNEDASRQDLKTSGLHLHENHVNLDCFLGNLDEACLHENDFKPKPYMVHDFSPANYQFEAEKVDTWFPNIKTSGSIFNDRTFFQNVNNYIETKGAQIVEDDQYLHQNQHSNQRKRKNQSQESHVVKRGKLGEIYTKLQNLVSPFGKANQATTLLEAIRCIKFLQEKVQALSSPYFKSSSTKNGEDVHKDLKSRGLCLVPFSCTLEFANADGEDCLYKKLFR